MTFPRSGVLSLEITPCLAACVSVPAVLVVCPPAGVCSRCSNTWSEVLDVTGVNKAGCERCARLPPFFLLSCHKFKLALTSVWVQLVQGRTDTLGSSGKMCVRFWWPWFILAAWSRVWKCNSGDWQQGMLQLAAATEVSAPLFKNQKKHPSHTAVIYTHVLCFLPISKS